MKKHFVLVALLFFGAGQAEVGAQPRLPGPPPKVPPAAPPPTEQCAAPLDGRGFDFGDVVLPPGATDVKQVDQSQVGRVTGKVSDLYGNMYNTRTDAWYPQAARDPKRPCPFVVGGPPPTNVPNVVDLVQKKTGLTDAQQQDYAQKLEGRLKSVVEGAKPVIDVFRGMKPVVRVPYTEPQCFLPGTPPKPIPCDQFLDANSPFGGRDIIYVHGLMPHSIYQKVRGDVAGARSIWPFDRGEFFGDDPAPGAHRGWWKQQADDGYWKPHIDRFLGARSAHNRFLIVAWPSTQNLEFGVHAALTQIVDAMTNGTDVRTERMRSSDLRGNRAFCVGGCVIVSHSTGGPVSDVAMSIAGKTGDATNPLRPILGDLSFVPNHVKAHVALAPALSGSGLAAAAVGAALFPADPVICPLGLSIYALLQGDNVPDPLAAGPGCALISPIILSSVLRDLAPIVMRSLWGPFIGSTPVPVLTVTGGATFDTSNPTKFLLLNGLDDGVVQMDSTCARTNVDALWPAGFFFDRLSSPLPNPLLFDPAMEPLRAGNYFADQTGSYHYSVNPVPRAAAACTPYKAPWGMIEDIPPEEQPFSSPMATYPNHYSFLQSASTHHSFVIGDAAGVEDVRAIADEAVYTRGLVSASLQGMEEEEVRGKKVTFRLQILRQSFSYEWWVWKRTYHRLLGWQTKHADDYVYDFVLKP
jgi:hypothetical protein